MKNCSIKHRIGPCGPIIQTGNPDSGECRKPYRVGKIKILIVMKKKIVMAVMLMLTTGMLGFAAGYAVKRASSDSCGKCNIANENRACGKCHSFLTVEKQEYKNGYLYTYYKCKNTNCNHRCSNKERK